MLKADQRVMLLRAIKILRNNKTPDSEKTAEALKEVLFEDMRRGRIAKKVNKK